MTAHDCPSPESVERDARELFVHRLPFATSRITVRVPLVALPKTEALIPLFHELIRTKALEGAPLVDVAHYGHVKGGPGIFLIGQDGHYAVDLVGQGGVRYARKRRGPESTQGKLDLGLRQALKLGQILEARAGLRLSPDRIEVIIEDRLAAPNDLTTLDAVKLELQTWLAPLVGARPELSATLDPRAPFGVTLSGWARVSAATLLERLG